MSLSATIATVSVPRWKANTAYAAGDKVVSPNGDTVTAKAAFTSGATYSATNWDLPASLAGKLAATTAATTYATKAEAGSATPAAYAPVKVYAAGKSTMQGLAADLPNKLAYAGVSFLSSAVGGFKISNIAAAVGTRPVAVAAVTVPASGGVTVVPMNLDEPNTYSPATWTGTLAGIPGTVSKPVNVVTWTFTRTASGTATAVAAGTPFIPSPAAGYRGGIALLNTGQNTLTATLLPGWDVERVISMTESLADYFGGTNARVLYIGHFVDQGPPAVSTSRDRIKAFNTHFAAKGARFFDLAAYVTSPDIWTDTGITPTQADLDEQALGNKPPSLSADAAHLNTAGYNAVNNRIRDNLIALGWLPAIPTSFSDDFARADGTRLGAPWTELAGGGQTVLSISSGRPSTLAQQQATQSWTRQCLPRTTRFQTVLRGEARTRQPSTWPSSCAPWTAPTSTSCPAVPARAWKASRYGSRSTEHSPALPARQPPRPLWARC